MRTVIKTAELTRLIEKKLVYKEIDSFYLFLAMYDGKIDCYNDFQTEEDAKEQLKKWLKNESGMNDLLEGTGIFKVEINKIPVDLSNEGFYWAFIGIRDSKIEKIEVFNNEDNAKKAFEKFTIGMHIRDSFDDFSGEYWERRRIPAKIENTTYRGSSILYLDGLNGVGW